MIRALSTLIVGSFATALSIVLAVVLALPILRMLGEYWPTCPVPVAIALLLGVPSALGGALTAVIASAFSRRPE